MRRVLAVLSIVTACGGAGGGSPDAAPRIDAGPFEPPPALCDPPVEIVDTTTPDRVVGDGTPGSCTEGALAAAIAQGGRIAFSCGPDPHTILVTAEIDVGVDAVLDGAGLITLDGGDTTRILGIHGSFERTNPSLIVQRLTFTRGRASGSPTPLGTDVDGGGGAIFHLGGNVTAIDSRFLDNTAALLGPDVGGGAIYGIGAGVTTVVGCEFTGNRASNGGALGALHTELTIVNSVLTGNTATGHGANYIDPMTGMQAGQGGNGGAVVMDGENRALTICGSRLEGNTGGAIGGALFRTSYHSEPTVIDRSVFDGNSVVDHVNEPGESSMAGAIYLQGSAVTLTATSITRNRAAGTGGIWIGDHGPAPGTLDATNVTIAGNEIHQHPALEDNGLAGGVWLASAGSATLLNCTIADNFAQFGAGIVGVERLTLRNSIVWNRSLNEWVPVNCANLGGGVSGTGGPNLQWPSENAAGPDFPCAAGITFADPQLAPLASGDRPGDVMVPAPASPARGAGTNCPPIDQHGRPRAADGCTLGAIE